MGETVSRPAIHLVFGDPNETGPIKIRVLMNWLADRVSAGDKLLTPWSSSLMLRPKNGEPG